LLALERIFFQPVMRWLGGEIMGGLDEIVVFSVYESRK
jgi:hypothetical protein